MHSQFYSRAPDKNVDIGINDVNFALDSTGMSLHDLHEDFAILQKMYLTVDKIAVDCCFVAQRDDSAQHGFNMMSHLTMVTAILVLQRANFDWSG
jgi:hypothetical protein